MFSYNALNLLTRADYADSTATFAYDAVGRLIQAGDTAGGDILYSYDSLDRLIQETTALGSIRYTYDALGRRRTMQVPGQSPTGYDYDPNSRNTRITQGEQIVGFTHDVLGRRTSLTLPNGVAAEYGYDAAGRLTALSFHNQAGVLGNLSYEYDATGKRKSVGGSFARTLLPDPVSSTSYDAANRQQQFGGRAMAFDANGNVASISDAAGTMTLAWDARDRLTSFTHGDVTGTFGYDVVGRRREQTTHGGTTHFLYDLVDIVQTTRDGARIDILQGSQVDEPVSRGGNEYYLADDLGSVLALTDPTGALQDQYAYGPFGETAASGPSENPFRFTGRESDETGLYYLRARYYSPQLQRFLSEDPIGPPGWVNGYVYVNDSPPNATDPYGLDCVSANGTTTCSTADYTVSFPTPRGWQDFDRYTRRYHSYSIPVDTRLSDASLWRWLVSHPTPAHSQRAATWKGSRNDATPFVGGLVNSESTSPVISYVATNQRTNGLVVVNVTLPGHPLFPGIVVREVSGSTIKNYGEGTAWLQSDIRVSKRITVRPGEFVNSVWKIAKP